MIKSAITVSLVAQAKGGPFVYWDGLASAAASAAKLGFDAIEIFAPSAASIDRPMLHALLKQHSLSAAAFGTGGEDDIQNVVFNLGVDMNLINEPSSGSDRVEAGNN